MDDSEVAAVLTAGIECSLTLGWCSDQRSLAAIPGSESGSAPGVARPVAVVLDAAERATWGVLRIELGDRILTQVRDCYTQNVRDSVDDSLLPLAEWLARNWLAITGAVWPPPPEGVPRRVSYEWRRSHRVRMAGQGGALPDIALWRSDETGLTVRVRADDPQQADGRLPPGSSHSCPTVRKPCLSTTKGRAVAGRAGLRRS